MGLGLVFILVFVLGVVFAQRYFEVLAALFGILVFIAAEGDVLVGVGAVKVFVAARCIELAQG